MPYRRLPNTHVARLRALKIAVDKALSLDFHDRAIQPATFEQARSMVKQYETLLVQYQDSYAARTTANKIYMNNLQKARMYISHFIQVFNLAVIRGEIKRDYKAYYQLDKDDDTVPNLTSEEDILKWGANIIEGEEKRISEGGTAIYFPSIAKVRVYYDIFKEQYISQQQHRRTKDRMSKEVEQIRGKIDTIILDIWNDVEEFYKDCNPYEKWMKCQEYGLVYYFRKGEEVLTSDAKKEEFVE